MGGALDYAAAAGMVHGDGMAVSVNEKTREGKKEVHEHQWLTENQATVVVETEACRGGLATCDRSSSYAP